MNNPDINKEFLERKIEAIWEKLYNIEYFLKPSPEDSSGMPDTIHDKLTDIDNRLYGVLLDTLSSIKKRTTIQVFLLIGILLVLLLK